MTIFKKTLPSPLDINYTLLQVLNKLKVQEINHKNDIDFNIMDISMPLTTNQYAQFITLYDLIPNSIRKVFLKMRKPKSLFAFKAGTILL